MERIQIFISDIAGKENIRFHEPMKNHTSFKVGGPADILVTPCNTGSLVKVLEVCRMEKIPTFVMGNGTNIIVRDKGIRGVVVKLSGNFNKYFVKEDSINAWAGILISKISKIALENELTGMEFAEGIPGTLGGAVVMNAGAYNGEMSSVTALTEYIDKSGNLRIIEGEEHRFGRRTSLIQENGGIIIRSVLKLKKGDRTRINALMSDFSRQRREKQPLELPSAGSIFKRPEGYYAGKLIEDCGLKGICIGGAEVSAKHCGFIVNKGNATADDIIRLIESVKESVCSKFGIELHAEVKIVGEK